MLRKCFTLVAACCIAWGTARFCHRETQGFRMTKITGNFSPVQDWCIPPLPKAEETNIHHLLDQKFTYFGRGFQSFVFLGEDGQTILKLFSNTYQWRSRWLNLIPPVPFAKEWKEEKLRNCQSKLLRSFQSYKISFEELKDRTGLIYVHLDPSPVPCNTTIIIDKLGIEHSVALNSTGFVLQKRAEMVHPALDRLLREQKLEEAKQRIRSLLQLIVDQSKLGIADSDPLIRTNFGFLEGQAIHIDVGPFFKDPSIAQPEVYLKELDRITTSLKHWLENNHPEITPFLAQMLQEMKNSISTE